VPGSSFEARHFLPIYAALNRAHIDYLIVGGQACNLWALMYEDRVPDLKSLRPYTTKDLDVWSRYQTDVVTTAELLHVAPTLADPGSAAPDMGHFTYRSEQGNLFVQFLTGVYGVQTDLVIRSKQNYFLKGDNLHLAVMHPLLALESKLKCLYGLDQTGRQDLKHLKMGILYTPSFIVDRAKEGEARDALRMCQHLLKLAGERPGIRLFHEKGISLETVIPVTELSDLPKFSTFLKEEMPRVQESIKQQRTKSAPQIKRIERLPRESIRIKPPRIRPDSGTSIKI